jgi:uncharacterized protein (DUF362 family)
MDDGKIEKVIGTKLKVTGITKVMIPSPTHPIVPYNVLILEDENGNRMPKKTMKDYKIGDAYSWENSNDESAVSLVKIKYDFYEALKLAVELIGGIVVKKNTRILIKPDIMTEGYSYQGMTTNSKVVAALVEYLINKGADKSKITIAEQTQYGEFDGAVKKTGILDVAKKTGVNLVDLSKTEFVEKESDGFKFKISKEVFNQDLIINLPVMKTHLVLGISGALENITRVISKENYKEYEKNPEKAPEAIAQLHKVLPKYITIGDASIGMEGNGPLMYGEPSFLNMIMGSRDPVAIDKVFQEIGLLRKAPIIDAAAKAGIGSSDLREITIVGEELDCCRRELKPAIGSKLIKF